MVFVNGENLYVAGVNYGPIQCGGGTAEFDESTHTLTLTNADITKTAAATGVAAILLRGDINIELIGNNSIVIGEYSMGIYNEAGNINISGTGAISIDTAFECIYARTTDSLGQGYGNITIDSDCNMELLSKTATAIATSNYNIDGVTTNIRIGTTDHGSRTYSGVANIENGILTEKYTPVLCGVKVEDGKSYTYGNGTVLYNEATNILTLDNVTIEYDNIVIMSQGDCKINLIGNNTINLNSPAPAIMSNGNNMEITGKDATLNITGTYAGIMAKNLTMDIKECNISDSICGMQIRGDMNLTGKYNIVLEAENGMVGIMSYGEITLDGSMDIEILDNGIGTICMVGEDQEILAKNLEKISSYLDESQEMQCWYDEDAEVNMAIIVDKGTSITIVDGMPVGAAIKSNLKSKIVVDEETSESGELTTDKDTADKDTTD